MALFPDAMARLRGSPFGRWLSDLFCAYRAGEPVAGTFRARQLQAVLRLTPLTMLANAVNAGLILAVCWSGSHRVFLLAWTAGVAALVVQGMRVWQRWRRSTATWISASPLAMRRATVHAALLGLVWAAVPIWILGDSTPPQQLMLATITTGMMCAGGFALATVPAAGTAYVLILGAGSAAALFMANLQLAWAMSALLLVYTFIVVASVWSTARLFGARLMAEAEAERQNEVIGLLLRDFEENASDILWETDARDRLCHASPRMLSLLKLDPAAAGEHSLLDLVKALLPPGDEAAQAHWLTLCGHMARRQPFRDLNLATTRNGKTRWWSVSAKPLVDANGQHLGWRGVSRDVTDAHRANRRLSWLAHFDPLTRLANRHQLRAELAELLAPTSGDPQPFAVLCLDLDHFKTINDTMGHAVGDGLLQAVAERLRQGTRRSDTIARLGGDEFAVILRHVDGPDEAQTLTERLLAALQLPCEVQGTRIAVRCSVGVALAPRDGTEIDTLLNHGDLALYAAKAAGRGEYRLFQADMALLTRRRLIIEQELRHALRRGELTLAFQPQVDLLKWRVTGFEALLRWNHPELGEVPPSEFIPVAEEAGLIAEIGLWVLRQACLIAADWPQELLVSVNVSAVQAMNQDLVRLARDALRDSGLNPRQLELEITESIFLNETQATLAVLHGLREEGFRVALDDFGTGYSSLAYLRRFPFDTLKIDSSFVRELLQRRDARAIVRTIAGLARTLNMRTVAEGVEEPAQAGVLRQYGCDLIQGYLVSKPIRAAEVQTFLAEWHRHPLAQAPAALETLPMSL
jgi:diguanylate cyclase (GGDEF)-like protein/PAS domain S-box-containing protein